MSKKCKCRFLCCLRINELTGSRVRVLGGNYAFKGGKMDHILMIFICCLTGQNPEKGYEVMKFHRVQILSMTTLLTHTVAHSTKPSFRSKTNNQPLKKFLSLALSCTKVVKNWTSFYKIEWFENFNFLTTLFPKMTSNF